MLVHRQLVCLLPAGILNLFSSFVLFCRYFHSGSPLANGCQLSLRDTTHLWPWNVTGLSVKNWHHHWKATPLFLVSLLEEKRQFGVYEHNANNILLSYERYQTKFWGQKKEDEIKIHLTANFCRSAGQEKNFSSVFNARFQIYSSGWRDNVIVTWGNLEKSERFSSGCKTKTKENNKEDGIPVRSIHQLSYWPTLYRDSEASLGWRYQRTWSASFWSVFCFLVYWGPQLRTQWNREFLARCAVKWWFKKSVIG